MSFEAANAIGCRGSRYPQMQLKSPLCQRRHKLRMNLFATRYKRIETALRKKLLDRMLVAPPAFFESLIVTLLLARATAVRGKILGRSSDSPVMVLLTRMPWGSTGSTSRRNGMP
jgi:hypothetical protein